MNLAATVLLALAMSADAFAAAVVKGASLHRPRFREALRTGLIFGAIEATTPVIGWALGLVAARFIVAFDHWIAFALLAGLGARMIHAGLSQDERVDSKPQTRHSFWVLAATGLGTSIDALAVGVSLAFLDVNIFRIAVAIGLATFGMVTTGVMVGRGLGVLVGKRAEIVGGIVLILIGVTVLIEHLTAAP